MLLHPTLDLLNKLGLTGMAKGVQDLEIQPEARSLDHAEWLGLLLDQALTMRRQKRFENRTKAARLRHDLPSKISTIKPPGGWTAASSCNSDRVTGSARGAMCSSLGRAVWGKAFWLARSVRRLAARTSRLPIIELPACSTC